MSRNIFEQMYEPAMDDDDGLRDIIEQLRLARYELADDLDQLEAKELNRERSRQRFPF